MKLKRLELLGFKSFAQSTQISFNEGITGIVGPNGSGKSNIGDAVRWVLGEQSAKVLRGAKMEDIIFSGTEKRKALPYCEVSLVFDNSDSILNSHFSEVMVTRRVYRNGDSGYFLNKSPCRLKDILELFRDTGIGKEGYSIIGQGRIDEILSQKGEERRRVFEEAAGIVTFRVRKDEAEHKLQKTEENILRISDILEEISLRLPSLEMQSKTAREYLDLSQNLKFLDANIFLIRHKKLSEKIDVLKDQILKNELLSSQYAQLSNTLLAEREDNIVKQDALEEKIETVRKTFDLSNSRQFELKNQIDLFQNEIQNFLKNKDDLSREIREKESLLEDLTGRITSEDALFSEENALLENSLNELNIEKEVLTSLLEQSLLAENELEKHRQTMLDASNRLSLITANEVRQQTMLVQMRDKLSEVEDKIKNQSINVKNANQRLLIAVEEEKQCTERVQLLQADVFKLDEKLKELYALTSSLNSEHENMKSDLQRRNSKLHFLKELSKNYEGYYASVKKALEYSASVQGVHGVLARLMKVPVEIETAIEMILGGTLQHIVTENEQVAKEIILYLRTNKLGRATFLPISAIKAKCLSESEMSLLNNKNVLGVASEIVEYDDIYKNIIENVLGRTVITRDIDTAISISRKSQHAFNVVTTAGEVIRAGGSMTGGTNANETVSILKREREILILEESIVQQKKELSVLEKKLNDLLENTLGKKQEKENLLSIIRNEEILIVRSQERVSAAQGESDNQKAVLSSLQTTSLQINESIREIENDLENAKKETNSFTFNRDDMEKMTPLLQEKLHAARKEVELKREVISHKESDYTKKYHELHTARFKLSQSKAEKKSAYNSLEILKSKYDEVEEKIENNTLNLVQTGEMLSETAKEKEKITQELASLEFERKSLSLKIRKTQEELDLVHKDGEALSIELHKNQIALTRAEDDLNSRINQLWNSYELTFSGAKEYESTETFEIAKGEKEAGEIRKKIKEIGNVNVHSIDEFSQTKERFDSLSAQKNDSVKAKQDLIDLINQLLNRMSQQFLEEFKKLNNFFNETFTRLFGGGKAELSLDNPENPLECGINIIAQPPGKKLQLLSLLSGGERALTAIAILFAMLKLKPTPFCILDEIEAALDEANIGYFADYLEEYKKTTQFVVVTHRKGTMEHCDSLYGVAMQEKGVSSMVSVNLENYA